MSKRAPVVRRSSVNSSKGRSRPHHTNRETLMLSVLKIVGLVVLATVVILLVYVSTRPDQFRIARKEITESDAPKRVAMSLQFDKPMKANNHVVFTLQPQGSATEVTWEMTGTYG